MKIMDRNVLQFDKQQQRIESSNTHIKRVTIKFQNSNGVSKQKKNRIRIKSITSIIFRRTNKINVYF